MSDSLKLSKLESRENHDFPSAFGPLFSVAKTLKISPARCVEYLQMLEMPGLSRHVPCCTLLKMTRDCKSKDNKNKNGGIFHATPARHLTVGFYNINRMPAYLLLMFAQQAAPNGRMLTIPQSLELRSLQRWWF